MKKYVYCSETAIRDAQRCYRGRSMRGYKEDIGLFQRWVLFVKDEIVSQKNNRRIEKAVGSPGRTSKGASGGHQTTEPATGVLHLGLV